MPTSEDRQPDRLLAVPEVARRLAVSQWTVYRLLRGGAVPSLKVGSRRLVVERDLQSFIESARGKRAGGAAA